MSEKHQNTVQIIRIAVLRDSRSGSRSLRYRTAFRRFEFLCCEYSTAQCTRPPGTVRISESRGWTTSTLPPKTSLRPFESGTPPTLIKNATIWTGGHNGTEVIFGDLLLDGGIIKAVGDIPKQALSQYDSGFLAVIDANEAWITPGLFDLHSHIGVASIPILHGSSTRFISVVWWLNAYRHLGAIDVDSPHGPVLPWLR